MRPTQPNTERCWSLGTLLSAGVLGHGIELKMPERQQLAIVLLLMEL